MERRAEETDVGRVIPSCVKRESVELALFNYSLPLFIILSLVVR